MEVKNDRANQKGGGRRGGEEISERMLEGGKDGEVERARTTGYTGIVCCVVNSLLKSSIFSLHIYISYSIILSMLANGRLLVG